MSYFCKARDLKRGISKILNIVKKEFLENFENGSILTRLFLKYSI
jgi:hypothetical protein